MGVGVLLSKHAKKLSDDQTVVRLDVKLDPGWTKVDGLDNKIHRLDIKIEKVRDEARADFRTILGVQLTTIWRWSSASPGSFSSSTFDMQALSDQQHIERLRGANGPFRGTDGSP